MNRLLYCKKRIKKLSILSYLIFSYLILSYFILYYLILSYHILSYLILSYLILSYLILSYLISSYQKACPYLDCLYLIMGLCSSDIIDLDLHLDLFELCPDLGQRNSDLVELWVLRDVPGLLQLSCTNPHWRHLYSQYKQSDQRRIVHRDNKGKKGYFSNLHLEHSIFLKTALLIS